jgi:hypothetical protein
VPNSAVAPVRPACGTCAALLQSLGRPGCSGRRNCNVNLDELRGDRPDLDCEPQQAGGIPRNLQLDETVVSVLYGRRLRRPDLGCDGCCDVRSKVASRCRDWLGCRATLLNCDGVTAEALRAIPVTADGFDVGYTTEGGVECGIPLAVLTGFLFCGHLWADRRHEGTCVQREWSRRAEVLIPEGSEAATFSASRLFAAVYPEAVNLAGLIASPIWRHRAAGDPDAQRQFTTEVARRLHRPPMTPPTAVPLSRTG